MYILLIKKKSLFDVICVKKSVSLICQNGWRFFLSLDIFVDYDNAYIKLFSIELEKSGAFGRKYRAGETNDKLHIDTHYMS